MAGGFRRLAGSKVAGFGRQGFQGFVRDLLASFVKSWQRVCSVSKGLGGS